MYGSFGSLNIMNVYEIFDIELKNDSLAHAYLFIGGDRKEWRKYLDYVSSKIKCLESDLYLVEPEDIKGKGGEIKVQQIREILHLTSLSPNGNKRIIAVFNAERFNQSSGNILLKNLEEPQSQILFLLFSKFDSVLPTIKSRCRVIHLNNDNKDNNDSVSFDDKLTIFRQSFMETSREIEKIVKDEMVIEFCDYLLNYLEKKLIESYDLKIVSAIEKVNEAKKDISSNANARLTLENLILKIRHNL